MIKSQLKFNTNAANLNYFLVPLGFRFSRVLLNIFKIGISRGARPGLKLNTCGPRGMNILLFWNDTITGNFQ